MSLATLAASISSAGISAPNYAAVLQDLTERFQAIFGSDIYTAADSADGQLLALFATMINDGNQADIATWQSFSPTYAQGAGLSSRVKINGITRMSPSFSTAVGTVVGVAGTVITGGVVQDINGALWNLPETTTITTEGEISVTVTAQVEGALNVAAGDITRIYTPTFGWQLFQSTAASVPGDPVESDAALRRRQATAASLPSITPLGGVLAALQALQGVTRVVVYENDTDSADSNGLVARSIAVVIEGGDLLEIATVIGQKKTPGAALNGSDTQTYVDPFTGVIYTVRFYVLDYTTVTVEITVDTASGWSTAVSDAIKTAVADYISALAIGQPVQLSRVYLPAYLGGSTAFEITVLTLNGGSADITIDFNKAALCTTADVTITVAP